MGKITLPCVARAYTQSAENRESRNSGTALAIYSYTPSCERACGWGGARNRADRVSYGLTDKQVAGIIEAARFAFDTGRTFQRHWIIHYGKAGIEAQDGGAFVSRVLALVSKQARREGGALTALWVRECASDKGEHVHILMHLPAAMRLHGRTRRWIETAGGTWHRGISRVRIIGGRLSKVEANRDAFHAANAANVTRYMLKGARKETGAKLDLKRTRQSGQILGKRCGWTQNIGKAVRAKQPRKSGRSVFACGQDR